MFMVAGSGDLGAVHPAGEEGGRAPAEGMGRSPPECNVNVKFKVILHEQARYRGILQY